AKCRAPDKEAAALTKLSGQMRGVLATPRSRQKGEEAYAKYYDPYVTYQLAASVDKTLQGQAWRDAVAVRAQEQMLLPESSPVRMALVASLAGTKGPAAAAALARRAVFDLDPEVREAAVRALKSRPAAEYRAELVAGLRYPWPAFADHAAE